MASELFAFLNFPKVWIFSQFVGQCACSLLSINPGELVPNMLAILFLNTVRSVWSLSSFFLQNETNPRDFPLASSHCDEQYELIQRAVGFKPNACLVLHHQAKHHSIPCLKATSPIRPYCIAVSLRYLPDGWLVFSLQRRYRVIGFGFRPEGCQPVSRFQQLYQPCIAIFPHLRLFV